MASSTVPYSHSSTPIMEAWLIKALRLAHSKKPADQERLRRFYREVCDNESVASRITLADALREPRDPTVNVDSVEKETVSSAASGSASSSTATSASIPTSVRIRPATLIAEPSLGSSPMESGAQSITLISSLSSAATLVASNQHSSTAPPITTSTGTSGTLTADPNASRINKRTRVAFFNIFDATSPSSMSTSKSSPAVNNGSVRAGSLTGTTSVSASLSQTTVFTASPVSTVPSTGKPVTTTSGAIDLTGENDTQSEPMDTTAAISYTDISSSVTISTGKTSDIASADSSQVTAATAVNVSGSVRTNTSTSDAPTADNQLLAMLVAELACCECGKLTRQPQLEPDGKTMNANILVECVQCGALYHQMCHQPPVLTSSGTSHQDWRCGSCSTATAAATGGDHPQTTNQPTATLTATVTDVAASKTSASAVVSSSPSATDLGPTVGARKRKAGLQSVLSGTGFRRL